METERIFLLKSAGRRDKTRKKGELTSFVVRLRGRKLNKRQRLITVNYLLFQSISQTLYSLVKQVLNLPVLSGKVERITFITER
jgi:hypothetical protein